MHLAIPFLRVIFVAALSLSTHGLPIVDGGNYTSNSSHLSTKKINGHPKNIHVHQCPDGLTTGKHIVTVKEGLPRSHILGMVTSDIIELDYINSIVGSFDDGSLERIQARSDVSHISEECFMHSDMSNTPTPVTQQPAPWGLARLSSVNRVLGIPPAQLSYRYYSDGSCTNVYIVDSGINIHHLGFQGRAHWGATFGDSGSDTDDTGHGTHIAGIVGSFYDGVAKGANLIAVKVVGKDGRVEMGELHRALEWIFHHSKTTHKPSVVNLSMSIDGYNPQLERAVDTLVKVGIHVVVSAGNLNKDAGGSSPARLPSVITVGSSDIYDARTSDSNYGNVVDIYAPGVNIRSTFIGSNTASAVKSGTSMSVPHVTGLLAHYICLESQPPTPAHMKTKLLGYALNGVLSNMPPGLPNRLAHIPATL